MSAFDSFCAAITLVLSLYLAVWIPLAFDGGSLVISGERRQVQLRARSWFRIHITVN